VRDQVQARGAANGPSCISISAMRSADIISGTSAASVSTSTAGVRKFTHPGERAKVRSVSADATACERDDLGARHGARQEVARDHWYVATASASLVASSTLSMSSR